MSTDSVAQDQLQSFVRRIEALEDEIGALNGDKSEVYKEAKGNGFDTKVLRKVIADRRKDASERALADEIYQLYWDAIHGVVRAHVENIEEFDADGVIIEPQHRSSETTGAVPIKASAGANTGGENVAAPTSTVTQDILDNDDGKARDGGLAPISAVETGAPIQVRDIEETLSAFDVVNSNVTAFRTHNPATHFLSSKGLPRLHGCRKPDACGGSHRALCFSCSVAHDGPAFQGGAA